MRYTRRGTDWVLSLASSSTDPPPTTKPPPSDDDESSTSPLRRGGLLSTSFFDCLSTSAAPIHSSTPQVPPATSPQPPPTSPPPSAYEFLRSIATHLDKQSLTMAGIQSELSAIKQTLGAFSARMDTLEALIVPGHIITIPRTSTATAPSTSTPAPTSVTAHIPSSHTDMSPAAASPILVHSSQELSLSGGADPLFAADKKVENSESLADSDETRDATQ